MRIGDNFTRSSESFAYRRSHTKVPTQRANSMRNTLSH